MGTLKAIFKKKAREKSPPTELYPLSDALVQNSHPPSPCCFPQSLLMKLLAPCCVLPWKTARCLGTTAPMASNRTRMDVCSASVWVVSALPSLDAAPRGVNVPRKHEHDTFLPTCCFLPFCIGMSDAQHRIYTFAHVDVKRVGKDRWVQPQRVYKYNG